MKSEIPSRLLFEANPVPMWVFDRKTLQFLLVNKAAVRQYGYTEREFLAMTIADIRSVESLPHLIADPAKVTPGLQKRRVWKHRKKSGAIIDVEIVCSDLDFDGTEAMLVVAYDITDRKAAEKRIRHLAYHDALTGLPNRVLLNDRLLKAFAAARRRDKKVALLSLDIDRFKLINDSLGPNLGDLLLKKVAERLKGSTRDPDMVARIGGDEFVIALSDVRDAVDACVMATQILNAVSEKSMVQGHSLSISCSIGISIFPDHSTNSETLIKYAYQALSSAKENGRNNFRLFTEDLNSQAVERLNLEDDLRLALERNEFFLAFQPQIEAAGGEITGLEALIRWQHPELGLVPPDKFIPISEKNGLILPIGEWVLRAACAQARRWY
ncbi:MAG TPA: diguanylate cyclase, partial [Candidatus Binatia bacterium]|nr:diguanylate cyclase [Candidatus Binatia bacterium]